MEFTVLNAICLNQRALPAVYRRVTQWELDVVLEDRYETEIDGAHSTIRRGDVVYKYPGQMSRSHGIYHCYALTFDMSRAEDSNKRFFRWSDPTVNPAKTPAYLQSLPTVIRGTHFEEIVLLSKRLADASSISRSDPVAQKLLFLLCADGVRIPAQKSVYSAEIDAAYRYIRDHFDKEITMDELSALTHFNQCYLSRKFKEEVGISPIKMVKQLRMDKAITLLCETTLDACEVGAQCGYGSSAHFSSTFSRRFCCSPLEYRRRKRTEAFSGQDA